MKSAIFILLVLANTNLYSQNQVPTEIFFQISCGYAAQTSKDIKAFKEIVDRNDTSSIREKIFKGTKLEQILAAVALKYYQSHTSFELTEVEKKKLEQISKSKDRFSICFTCTFHQEGTVNQLFNQKKYSESYNIIEGYLSNSF